MAFNYKFVSAILCDDCRKEVNGKDIAIGIYTGSILSPQIPFMLPTFFVRFEVIPSKHLYTNVAFDMKSPDGEAFLQARGKVEFTEINLTGGFFFRFSPVIFEKEGEYKSFLGMDDEQEMVHQIVVRKWAGPDAS
jgi:hypothetical protein